MNNKSGFTLFELLIVLAIIGGMAAFLVPSFPSADNFSAREELNSVQMIIEKARNEALNEGKSFEFHLSPTEGLISIAQMVSEDLTETETVEKEELVKETKELKSIRLVKVEADRLYETETFSFKLSAFSTPPTFKAYFEGDENYTLLSNGTHAPLRVEPYDDEQ